MLYSYVEKDRIYTIDINERLDEMYKHSSGINRL